MLNEQGASAQRAVTPDPHQLGDIRRLVQSRLASDFEAFRTFQDASGRVVSALPTARGTLQRICKGVVELGATLGYRQSTEAFAADMEDWLSRGLDSVPNAWRTRATFRAPTNGNLGLFAGPSLAQNGPAPRGMFLEYFLVLREEPAVLEGLRQRYPHPLDPCQCTRMLAASRGFGFGNCVVFFPEYVCCKEPPVRQEFAVFFFNKFLRIYSNHTLPTVRATFAPSGHIFGDHIFSESLEPQHVYELRCVWGLLHDYFHHKGKRPLHQYLMLKQHWHAAVLEELKADCQTVLAVAQDRLEGWQVLVEFVMYDRMFRYPSQPDRAENFDSATGVLLFQWLMERGGLSVSRNGRLRATLDAILVALQEFVDVVESIEAVDDDEDYLRHCTAAVGKYVGATSDRAGFTIPRSYSDVVRPQPQTLLDMTSLSY